MLRSTLCLLFTAVFMSAAFAQQGHSDVQSLQYEFGRGVRPAAPVIAPVPRPVVCAPVYCAPVVCAPVYTACRPCYAPCRPVMPRRILLRSAYCPPYYSYGYSSNSCGCR